MTTVQIITSGRRRNSKGYRDELHKRIPAGGYPAGLNDSAFDENAFPGRNSTFDIATNPAPAQETNARLQEIKRGSIWTLARLAREHLDRLLWALEEEDVAEVRNQCRSVVSHVRVIAILVNDLNGECAHD